LAGGVSASTNAGAVSFVPTGSITSTTVQTAIEELDTDVEPLKTRYVSVQLNSTTALAITNIAYFRIPAQMTGMNLVSVGASVGTGASGASSSGLPTFTVKNVTDNAQILSTALTVDATAYTSATATTPAVIDTTKDDVATDDLIEIACTVAGTGVTYAVVTLGFKKP